MSTSPSLSKSAVSTVPPMPPIASASIAADDWKLPLAWFMCSSACEPATSARVRVLLNMSSNPSALKSAKRTSLTSLGSAIRSSSPVSSRSRDAKVALHRPDATLPVAVGRSGQSSSVVRPKATPATSVSTFVMKTVGEVATGPPVPMRESFIARTR